VAGRALFKVLVLWAKQSKLPPGFELVSRYSWVKAESSPFGRGVDEVCPDLTSNWKSRI
jgi:hypothetical protein